MSVPRLLSVVGTRPEAIKMAPLIKALASDERFTTGICVTAQHRQMLDQVLDLFELTPDFDLNVMKPGQQLADVTAAILKGMGSVLEEFKPDIVLVQGDTATTFATTLTGALTALHFAPTEQARNNLLAENVDENSIHVTGNTVVDALLHVVGKFQSDPKLEAQFSRQFDFLDPKKKLVLVTGHRRESFGEGFERICEALQRTVDSHEDVEIVYPVHLNPNVQEPVNRLLGHKDRVHLIEPLDYLPFVWLMNRAYLILTDSGGIQEEAPSLGKPVLVMRETTERPEAVDAGTVLLVGTNVDKIVSALGELLENSVAYRRMSRAHNPYGDGKACARIVDALNAFQKVEA
mgnify:CR=1 FL=1